MTGRRRWWLGMAAVLALALAVRLYRVNWQSVWFDEIFTLYACGLSPKAMLNHVRLGDINPPLHYFFLYGWLELFGYGALQGRLLSVAFGVLAVLCTGLLGRQLFGERVGILAGLLLALSTPAVLYSHEVRGYAQLMCFSMATCYFFVRTVREPSIGRWLLFVLCAVGCTYTHYYGAFTVLVLTGFAWVFRREYPIPLRWWLGGVALGLLAFAPWAALVLGKLGSMGRRATMGWAQVTWSTAVDVVQWFNGGSWFGFGDSPPWLLALGGVLFCLPLAWGSREVLALGADKTEAARARWLLLLNGLWLAPLLLIFAAHLVGGVRFSPRYCAYLSAPYSVLVAKGIGDIRSGALRHIWLGLALLFSAIGLRAVYYEPTKPDYRAAVNAVAARRQPGDCSVFLPSRWSEKPKFWSIYRHGSPPPELRTTAQVAEDPACKRVWLVWDRTPWRNAAVESEEGIRLIEESYRAVQREEFYRVEVRLYVPKK